jgi:hypothetical protein
LFRCYFLSRERCCTGKRRHLQKLAPWLQIACFPCHNPSSEICFGGQPSRAAKYNNDSRLILDGSCNLLAPEDLRPRLVCAYANQEQQTYKANGISHTHTYPMIFSTFRIGKRK